MGGLIQVIVSGALLLVPAGLLPGGTWVWKRGIALMAVWLVLVEAGVVFLAVKAPASLAVRMQKPVSKDQPKADRVVSLLLLLYWLIWTLFLPVDVFRLHLFGAPSFAKSCCGGVMFIAGFILAIEAIRQNSFAAPIVKDQRETGQRVIDTGLYGRVRHPMYTGALILFVGMPVFLGSYAALAAGIGLFVLLVARIRVEEAMLRRTLTGYTEYCQRVRYRLIPGIW